MAKEQTKKKHTPADLGRNPGRHRAPADDTVEVTLRKKSPWGPMSDKLKVVAEPWASRLGPNPSQVALTVVYELSSMIWNASRVRQAFRRSAELKEVHRIMAQMLPELSLAERRDLVQTIYDRAKAEYPDDPRLIVEIDVEDLGGGDFHVTAASVEL